MRQIIKSNSTLELVEYRICQFVYYAGYVVIVCLGLAMTCAYLYKIFIWPDIQEQKAQEWRAYHPNCIIRGEDCPDNPYR